MDSERSQVQKAFDSIEIGSQITSAIEILGSPTTISREFRLSQRIGYEDAFTRANNSPSVEFYIWECCIDHTFTLGVDSEGKVTISEHGGT